GRVPLSDRAVDADHVFVTLIDNCVQSNGRLACLAVANNQLALPTPNREERVDHLDPGLERLLHRGTVHNSWRAPFDRQTFDGGQRAAPIQWLPQRADNS